ncbi:hypothetical protein [Azospirillum argentinense]
MLGAAVTLSPLGRGWPGGPVRGTCFSGTSGRSATPSP